MADKVLFRFLDTNGDGTGLKNMNVDGSITPVIFKIQPPINTAYRYSKARLNLRHPQNIYNSTLFGNISALTNGLRVTVNRSSDDFELIDITDGMPVKCNGDWARYTENLVDHPFAQGDSVISIQIQIEEAASKIGMYNDKYLAIHIRDDLTALHEFTFRIFGTQQDRIFQSGLESL